MLSIKKVENGTMNMLNRRSFVLGLLSSSLIFSQSKLTFGHDNSSDLGTIEQYKSSEDVLIIVDMQNDFCPGGTLPVQNGDKVVEVINKIQKKFQYIILTQDWHPEDHSSFVTTNPQKEVFSTKKMPYGNQVIWPPHCIIGTKGAEFHKNLITNKASFIIRKGFRKHIDSYSGFFENDRVTSTGLDGILRSLNIKRVFVAGLALDFCVQYTAIDSAILGYSTYVIQDATLPVNIGNSVQETMNNFKKNNVGFGKLEEFI